MSKLAKNSIAAGLTTLLITAGVSFSAQGAATNESVATGRFLSGTIFGTDLDQVAALQGAHDETEDGTPVTNPLVLSALGIPLVDQPDGVNLDVAGFLSPSEGSAGVANHYANAEDNKATGASGAVSNTGGALAPGNGEYPATASIGLSDGLLDGTDENLAGVDLEIGALTSITPVVGGTPTADRRGTIGSLNLNLDVPLLSELVGDISTATGPVQSSDVTISPAQTCEVIGTAGTITVSALFDQLDDLGLETVSSALETLIATLNLTGTAPTTIDLCDDDSPLAPALGATRDTLLADLVEVNVTGLDAVTDGIADFGQGGGVVVSPDDGTISIDLEKLLPTGVTFENMPANTDLTSYLTDELFQTKVADILDSAINDILASLDEVGVSVTVAGNEILDLDQLKTQFPDIVGPLVTALNEANAQLSDALIPLDDFLGTLSTELQQLVQLIGNRQSQSTTPTLDSGAAQVSASALGDYYRTSALGVVLAGGDLADIDLAASEAAVLPAQAADDADTGGTTNDPTTADDSDVSADGADNDADGTDDSDVRGEETELTDSDSAADADVAGTLADAGAPNLLPFFLLGLALLAFGGAVMLNERRRLTDAV